MNSLPEIEQFWAVEKSRIDIIYTLYLGDQNIVVLIDLVNDETIRSCTSCRQNGKFLESDKALYWKVCETHGRPW